MFDYEFHEVARKSHPQAVPGGGAGRGAYWRTAVAGVVSAGAGVDLR
jgi:hypothetical protein